MQLELFRWIAPKPGMVEAPRVGERWLTDAMVGMRDRFLLSLRDYRPSLGMKGLASRFAKTAPPPVPAGARFEERMFSNAAGARTYKLYVPSGYDGRALPHVVMLHGCTQSPDDFAAGTRMNDFAERNTFLVAYPAQTQAANPAKCWNWFYKADQQRGMGEPSLIAGITQQIMQDYPVDAGRIYIAGLSAGGAAAAIMGVTYPDLYAAVGIHSGLACGAAHDLSSALAAMRNGGAPIFRSSPFLHAKIVPTIVFHGDADTTVNPRNGDDIIAQLAGEAVLKRTVQEGRPKDGIGYTKTIETDGAGHDVLEHWVLHGAGHAWSGGNKNGTYTDPRGPDASREMLRFFMQHSREA